METIEVKLHELLHPIDMTTYPKEKVQELWSHLQVCPYAFDDVTRGNEALFAEILVSPSNQFLELGDMQGMVMVQMLQPQVNAALHFAIWDPIKITTLRDAGKSLMESLFLQFPLNRLSAIIPAHNTQARRLASVLGFKPEGALREAFLFEGAYSDLLLYGMLRSEHEVLRRF